MSKGTVIVADDDNTIRVVLNQALTRAGYNVRVTSNASNLWKWVSEGEGDCVVSDVIMPDADAFEILPKIKAARPNLPVILISAQNTFMTALKAEEEGAFEYLPKPFDLEELVTTVDRAIYEPKGGSSNRSVDLYREEMPLVGRSPAMQEIYRKIARLRDVDLPVTLLGEAGTGKQLIANVLHETGTRKNSSFVVADLSAIPEDNIETELFGDEKSDGLLQKANGGTLYLSEVLLLPKRAQVRMLRVLREGSVLNGSSLQDVDIRVISGTTHNIEVAVKTGKFSHDLFYQLNVIPIEVPALRNRTNDIPDLIRHFLKMFEFEGLPAHHFNNDAIAILKNKNWPGNVLELENFIRKICLLYPQETITGDLVSSEANGTDETISGVSPSANLEFNDIRNLTEKFVEILFDELSTDRFPKEVYQKFLDEFEYPLITATLARTNGNQIQAAKILGLNRNTLRKKIQNHGIKIVKTAK